MFGSQEQSVNANEAWGFSDMPYGLMVISWRPEDKHSPNEASQLHHCSQHELLLLITWWIHNKRYLSRYGERLCLAMETRTCLMAVSEATSFRTTDSMSSIYTNGAICRTGRVLQDGR